MIFAVLLATLPVGTPASPAPSPTPRFALTMNGSNVFIDQSTFGPGITPPEGPGFAKGSPLSPTSPYGWFTAAPGFHFKYDHNSKYLEAHVSYGDWRQLVPETMANASQEGFVDGFFLLQNNGFGTRGRDRQVGLYVAWHLPHDDVTLDSVDDYLSRDADPAQAEDTVAIRALQLVGSLVHHFSNSLITVAGYGRYEAAGAWAITPVDAVYSVGFAGVQFATGPSTALLVEGRRYALAGLPSEVGGPPPTMHGTLVVVDERISIR